MNINYQIELLIEERNNHVAEYRKMFDKDIKVLKAKVKKIEILKAQIIVLENEAKMYIESIG